MHTTNSKVKIKLLIIVISLITSHFSLGQQLDYAFTSVLKNESTHQSSLGLNFPHDTCTSKAVKKGKGVVIPVPRKLKVVQCWDDSYTTDIPLVALLKKHHAKATFNIIPREKRLWSAVKKMNTGSNVLFSFLPKDRTFENTFKIAHLSNAEMPEIYKGFNVSAHCRIPLGGSLEDSRERMQILKQTKVMIRDEFMQEKCGFVYPGGNFSEAAKEDIEKAGYIYARTSKSKQPILNLGEPFELRPSCHWASPNFWVKYEEAKKKGGVFYFWGHSSELGNDPNLWNWLESIYQRISNDPEAEWCDVVDLFQGTKNLSSNSDNNP